MLQLWPDSMLLKFRLKEKMSLALGFGAIVYQFAVWEAQRLNAKVSDSGDC